MNIQRKNYGKFLTKRGVKRTNVHTALESVNMKGKTNIKIQI
jgi:hypothetical protein